MKITHITSAVIALAIGAAAASAAQAKPAPAPMQHGQMAHPSKGKSATQPRQPKDHTSFKGVADKLGTTPAAMETAYAAARQTNAKLTRSEFIEANVLAKNLGPKNPAITTQAVLDGLQSGKSVEQTLQGLGLSEAAADSAEKDADRFVPTTRHSKPAKPAAKPTAKPDSTKTD